MTFNWSHSAVIDSSDAVCNVTLENYVFNMIIPVSCAGHIQPSEGGGPREGCCLQDSGGADEASLAAALG